MEKRALIAAALSLLFVFLWQEWMASHVRPGPPPSAVEGQMPQPSTAAPTPATEPSPSAASVETVPGFAPFEAPAGGRTVVVETPLVRATFSTAGALLRDLTLARYRVGAQKNSPRVDLVRDERFLPLGIDLGNEEGPQPGDVWEAEPQHVVLKGKEEATIRFVWRGRGIEVEKRLTFHGDRYLVDLDVEVRNLRKDRDLDDRLSIEVASGLDPALLEERGLGGFSISQLEGDRVTHTPYAKVRGTQELGSGVRWAGVEDKYFLLAVIPRGVEHATATARSFAEGVQALVMNLTLPLLRIPPGGRFVHHAGLYLGPKEWDALKAVGVGLEGSVDFGFFGVVAKAFYWILRFFYAFFGNYGLAIIGLTALVRLAVLPLSHSQFRNMKLMQKIQPRIKELQEKYKDDQQKQSEETMKLFRSYGVNPLGCVLPMVIQIPVFVALYDVLLSALELRHAPFLWIADLSAPDEIFRICAAGGHCFHGRLLPLIMGGTMLGQSLTAPQTGDPAQVKLMTWGMPLMFLVMFWNFPSGLNLYWLVQNLFSIAQQVWLNRKFAREGI